MKCDGPRIGRAISREGTVVASSDFPPAAVPESAAKLRAVEGVGGAAALATAELPDARRADYELVQRLIAGEALAWRTFVERFGRLVLARVNVTAREMNQSLAASDAEDLCAEVFSQLVANQFAALARFEGRSALSTWLCVVARRVVLRRLTSERRELARAAMQTRILAVELLPGSGLENPLALLISDEDRAQVASALAQLGDRQREMARLFYIDGCSYREISQKLDMPMNSVGPTLNRIHAKLRAALVHE
jgi:RNA polymerase sigma-70 factor, ECF subfamily